MQNEINFEEITLRLKVSSRGGGIEIDLTTLGFKGEKMTAYQNYLGGGLLGSINSDNTIKAYGKSITEAKQRKLDKIEEQLMRYFYSLTNPDESEFESMDFDTLQSMPSSAY